MFLCVRRGTFSSSATLLQVLPPAQRHSMGGSEGRHGHRVHLWQEWSGEPIEHEPKGACAISHPGVCCEHRGARGLHAVLHQWYHSSDTTKQIFVFIGILHTSVCGLGCAVTGCRSNKIRTWWAWRLGLYDRFSNPSCKWTPLLQLPFLNAKRRHSLCVYVLYSVNSYYACVGFLQNESSLINSSLLS